MIRLSGRKRTAIAIDLGGTSIKGALIDEKGAILVKKSLPTEADKGYEVVRQNVLTLIEFFQDKKSEEKASLEGIGLGVPGTIDPRSPHVVTFAPNLHWRNVPIGSDLAEQTKLPVFMENDANLAACGEYWKGSGQGAASMALITLGTGVGCGLILDHQLYRGSKGAAGEIGHLVLVPDGPLCNCGRKGCLEALVGAPAIVAMAQKHLALERSGFLATVEGPLEARHVFDGARQKDPMALSMVQQVAGYLGWGLALLLNLLNLERILIGGGMAQAGDVLFNPLRDMVKQRALPAAIESCEIQGAILGNDAGIMGAAAQVFQSVEKVGDQ
ncbi:ROK family protein [Heliorestis convoluta]|uniref:Glucokinase n=1 Tax=Heliorestis convoluta TaxID=356322 RepID=A0A5Q2MXX3_9FIRM|nr:ROK family protein [Heliorestis convoluta]QGG46213.1 ROK family glucokinase [Heliorestis convoluta]